jgi:hypothetical protein
MKNLPIFLAVALLALGSCTEIEYRDVEKLIRDTVKVKEFVDRYYAGTDTVTITQVIEVPIPARSQADTVVQYVYDTIYLERIDTLWITKTVVEHTTDTIMVREISYGDTLVQYLWPRGAYGLPMELEPIYTGFFEEVERRNISYQGSGSAFMIQWKSMDSALQAYSFDYGGQICILINDRLTVDQSFAALWRELSRVFLKNEYSTDPNNIMFPFYPTDKVRWSNRNQFPNEVNEFFN